MVNREGLSSFERVLKGVIGKTGVIVLEVNWLFLLVLKVFLPEAG